MALQDNEQKIVKGIAKRLDALADEKVQANDAFRLGAKEIATDAKRNGVNVKMLKRAMQARDLQAKADALGEGLEGEQADLFVDYCLVLGVRDDGDE